MLSITGPSSSALSPFNSVRYTNKVWAYIRDAWEGWWEVVSEEHSEVKLLLEEGVDRIRERRYVECTGSIGYGGPVDEIENTARDFNADLVVIGTRKLGGLDRWWRKRIGKNLIVRLPCSLLIAIPPEDFEPENEK